MIRLLGGDFKESKSQKIGVTADFLGLVHDVSHAIDQNTVTFEPLEALITKATTLASRALIDGTLIPTTAGKLLGVRAFTESGLFSRVGRAGQGALIQRTHADLNLRLVCLILH